MKQLQWDDLAAIECVVQELSVGGVVLGDTDTVLGLLANTSQEGRDRIDAIKKRVEKPYLILIGDAKKALEFVSLPAKIVFQFEKLINICWPGPVTLVFPARHDVPLWMASRERTIALRVPDHAGLQALLNYFPALFSTSANSAGEPVPKCLAEVEPEVLAAVTAIVVDNGKRAKSDLPSTILDCTDNNGVVKVIRRGAADSVMLERESGLQFEQ